MTTKPDDPITPQDPHKDIKGLTKRELFAAMALQGLIAGGNTSEKGTAEMAVFFADALIRKLNGELG